MPTETGTRQILGFWRVFGRIWAMIGVTLLAVMLLVFGVVRLICSDISPSAKKVFVTTMLETGQLKFAASIFLDDDEIRELVQSNSLEEFHETVDTSMIRVEVGQKSDDPDDPSSDGIEIIEISGRTFLGTLMIVHDPSRVSVESIYPWRAEGITLDKIVEQANAVGGINGGLYNSTNNTGGMPYGVLVSHGEIQYNAPQVFPGLVLIGLTEDHILQIVDIDGYTAADVETLVRESKIRDAVVFQEEASDANNHFVGLVINGKARQMNGMGSGLNPRTVIGQRADGSLLLLVTDGRARKGHLGASASDLINIMLEYGAVNAANLDGGSSSCMYYNGKFLRDSVTFIRENTSWKMPAAFVIK